MNTDLELTARPNAANAMSAVAGSIGFACGAAPARNSAVQVDARDVFRMLRIDLDEMSAAALENEFFVTRRLAEGETLMRAGDPFHALYVVRCGFFKTILIDEFGNDKVLNFIMKNELLGADGLASGHYASDAVALEGSEVIVIPFARMSMLARRHPDVERGVYSILSRELVRDQGLLYVLAMLNAEGRVAAFLLNLSDRFAALGYARSSFLLRMTRQEIGSFLGLKLETVSRSFSALDAGGIIKVNLKQIEILDATRLRALIEDPSGVAAERAAGIAAARASGRGRKSAEARGVLALA